MLQPNRTCGPMRCLSLVLRVLWRLLARVRERRGYCGRPATQQGRTFQSTDCLRTHLAVAPQVNVRLQRGERRDVVRDVVHLR